MLIRLTNLSSTLDTVSYCPYRPLTRASATFDLLSIHLTILPKIWLCHLVVSDAFFCVMTAFEAVCFGLFDDLVFEIRIHQGLLHLKHMR